MINLAAEDLKILATELTRLPPPVSFFAALVAALAICFPSAGLSENALTTIYIVRHAEKKDLTPGEKEPPGPRLTLPGASRATALKDVLTTRV